MRSSSRGLLSALQRRPKSLIVAFTALVLFTVVAVRIDDLFWWRARTIDAAEARAANLAFVLSQHVRDSFAVADTSLRQLAIHGRRVGGAAAPDDVWRPMLAAARDALSDVGSITVTNAEGLILHSTQPVILGQSRNDTYVFKQLSVSTRDVLIVDRPFLSKTSPKEMLIPIGRRLTSKDGAFDGMVVATLRPEVYRRFFRNLDAGHRGTTWVFHPDGFVLFREPATTDPLGEAANDNPILTAARQTPGAGVVTVSLPPDNERFICAYQTVEQPPLIVAVSLSRTEILTDWRQQRRASGRSFLLLTATVGALMALMFRQMNARARVQRELDDVQRQEAQRLREANEQLAGALDREQQARRETEAAGHLKDEFLMTLSHELRTPLTAIYGWARILATTELTRDEQARAVAAVERNARAQTRLIDDLLEVSGAITGKLRIEARSVDPVDVVSAAIDTVRPGLDAKRIRLDIDLGTDIRPIVADPDRLQQIVWNLLSNAMKFTPEGGRVTIALAQQAGGVEIAVSDTGVGIAPALLPHVFERFRQGEVGTQRRFGGLGLGLAIVRHLVELHGGTVDASSQGEGQGATFRVRLPGQKQEKREEE